MRIASQRNACPSEPLGKVAPTCATLPSEARRIAAAATAPGELRGPVERRRGDAESAASSANASVTAGLKCAPETCPTA